MRISWSGEAKDGSGNSLVKVVGSVDLPYIADENADEEPDLKVTVKDESPVGQRLREAFLAKGKPLVLKKIAQFVKDMAAGGPAKEELEGKATSKTSVEKTATRKASTGQESVKVPAPPATKPMEKEGFKTISLTERFHCRPKDIYGVLLDENRWKGFTQSAAKISKEVGGSFSIFDGAVTGINVQLEEDKLIVQKWRFTSWADGHYSNVGVCWPSCIKIFFYWGLHFAGSPLLLQVLQTSFSIPSIYLPDKLSLLCSNVDLKILIQYHHPREAWFWGFAITLNRRSLNILFSYMFNMLPLFIAGLLDI